MSETLTNQPRPRGVALTGARALWLVLALALAAIVGIVGMLFVEGGWDLVLLAMTASPLLVGAGLGWRLRGLKIRGWR